MYVYSNIITEQFVGGIKTPLLRIVNIPGLPNSGVEEFLSVTYDALYYASLKSTLMSVIDMAIYDRGGYKMHFTKGVTRIILEFRKIVNAI